MEVKNTDKWMFFCHIKCMSEKRLSYRLLKRALFVLTGKKVSKLPENHILRGILDDLEYCAGSLLQASNPDEAKKMFDKTVKRACQEIERQINNLIIE